MWLSDSLHWVGYQGVSNLSLGGRDGERSTIGYWEVSHFWEKYTGVQAAVGEVEVDVLSFFNERASSLLGKFPLTAIGSIF